MQLELLKQSELLKAREEYKAEIKTGAEQLEEELSRAHEQMGYKVDRERPSPRSWRTNGTPH